MSAKDVKFSGDARDRMLRGVHNVAAEVEEALGERRRTGVIER
jgi:chaperonin GroEL